MTENQECPVQASVPRVTCIAGLGHRKSEKLHETAANDDPEIPSPNAVNSRALCQGPSRRRHLKQKNGSFRNVGGTWAKRGWKRGRNGLESGIAGCMVWFWVLFVGASTQAFYG